MEYLKMKIADIISDNPFIAKALHFLGIQFSQYADHTLEELCKEKGLSEKMVLNQFNEVSLETDSQPEILRSYPIDLIIGFLRHSHHLFIKNRLPFLQKLVQEADVAWLDDKQILHDLKFVFPIFAEDFIVHIYHEEDTLFGYVASMNKALQGIADPAQLLKVMERLSISRLGEEHETHDDEMLGIRQLTNNYELSLNAPVGLQVLYHELQTFE
jgi:regulator of cell morphogenesis and NO signaling